jgi:Helix-turn-helix domain
MTEAEVAAQFKEAGIRVTPLGHFVAEVDLASSLEVEPRTVQRWREDGTGPIASRVGGRWVYSCADIAEWVNSTAKARQTTTRTDRP